MLRIAADGLPEGWFSEIEVRAYQRALGEIRRGVVVEIGAWYGRSTAAVAGICRDNHSRLIVVDTWEGSANDPTHMLAATGPDPFAVFQANLNHLGLWNAVEVRRQTSLGAAAEISDASCDAILLDADHEYPSVAADIAAWWPKLRPGGVFLGHDYRPEFPGVVRAVQEHAARYHLPAPHIADSLWQFVKPGRSEPLATTPLRVAVITPMYQTDPEWLAQCCRSVQAQTYPCHHFVVCDGVGPVEVAERYGAEVVTIPGPCRDYGDTPRSIGSLLAIAKGFDALVWLDADNWLLPNHIATLVELQQRTGAVVCTSSRSLQHMNGEPLGPCYEVNGTSFVDTNCYLVTRPAFDLAALWGTLPTALHKVGDRLVWSQVGRWRLSHAHSELPTVAYRTQFRIHYEHFGVTPPPDAKASIAVSPDEARLIANFCRPSPAATVVAGSLAAEQCVVIVPHLGQIHGETENGLRELERRGYVVWRKSGYSAIDQGRCQLATDALAEGFQETMWIDSDIGFLPDDVDRLRAKQLPISCALYPQKGRQAIACYLKEGTKDVVFGEEGGLVEVRYAGAGFLHVRREVYDTIEQKLQLPPCNIRFGRKMLPFFLPLVIREKWGPNEQGAEPPPSFWYLAEDFAFCERSRKAGFQIFADTTIRLRHFGYYGYSWEDAGSETPRYGTYHFRVRGQFSEREG